MKYLLLFAFASTLVLSSCGWEEEKQVIGYKPIYLADSTASWSKAPQPVRNPGRVYHYQDYLFVNEVTKGLHVYNNADPSNPVAVGFIQIPFNSDLAIKGDLLYANSGNDLVVLDISDVKNVRKVGSVLEAFDNTGNDFEKYPPEMDVYFECVDAAKGQVIGWEKIELENPTCFR